MIIGNGLTANGFKNFNHSNYVILAAGVSNSLETRLGEFEREKDLILDTIKQYPDKKIVYFSTVLINSLDNPYYSHKKEMEKLIASTSKEWTIFRVPQLVSAEGNSSNLIHYLKDKILQEDEFVIYEGVMRSLLDIEDLVKLVKLSITKVNRGIINISGIEILKVINICELLALTLNKPLRIVVEDKYENSTWTELNDVLIESSMLVLDIKSKGYTKNLINKYIKKWN
jgi:nucleoside-diphosphate-sugar epimerase